VNRDLPPSTNLSQGNDEATRAVAVSKRPPVRSARKAPTLRSHRRSPGPSRLLRHPAAVRYWRSTESRRKAPRPARMDVRHAQQPNPNTNLTSRDEVLGFVTIDVSNEDKTARM